MRFEKYLLNEKTFNISKDVDLLYNKSYKDFLKIFEKYKYDFDNKDLQKEIQKKYKNGRDVVFYETDSSILKSKDSKFSHAVNPVDIKLGIFYDGSFYRPTETVKAIIGKGNGLIQISLHEGVLNIITTGQLYKIPSNQMKSFKNEITLARAKASISHELSHWINDSLHNFNITNTLKIARELNNRELSLLGKKDVNMTHFEIDAQIHSIKQVKMAYKKEWDNFTLFDLFNIYTSLRGIALGLVKYGEDVVNIWQKILVKRMDRENILGKNMRKFITIKDIRNM